jgi:hypothetical protein
MQLTSNAEQNEDAIYNMLGGGQGSDSTQAQKIKTMLMAHTQRRGGNLAAAMRDVAAEMVCTL